MADNVVVKWRRPWMFPEEQGEYMTEMFEATLACGHLSLVHQEPELGVVLGTACPLPHDLTCQNCGMAWYLNGSTRRSAFAGMQDTYHCYACNTLLGGGKLGDLTYDGRWVSGFTLAPRAVRVVKVCKATDEELVQVEREIEGMLLLAGRLMVREKALRRNGRAATAEVVEHAAEQVLALVQELQEALAA